MLVIPASLVKGLEFDCVLMADVSETSFPDDALDARLLYVCLTRPLHRLLCCHIGRGDAAAGRGVSAGRRAHAQRPGAPRNKTAIPARRKVLRNGECSSGAPLIP